jgi:ribosomal protein S18 acetylase RimI-like enzyme
MWSVRHTSGTVSDTGGSRRTGQRVRIERVGEAHLDELLPLLRGYCDFYEASPPDEALLALARALIADPEREGVQLLARDDDDRPVGFATVYWSWATTSAQRIGVMNDLYVAPEARGSGAAEALIEACRDECARQGAGKLTWQTAPDNERAQRVYDRIGATKEQWVDYWLDSSSR